MSVKEGERCMDDGVSGSDLQMEYNGSVQYYG